MSSFFDHVAAKFFDAPVMMLVMIFFSPFLTRLCDNLYLGRQKKNLTIYDLLRPFQRGASFPQTNFNSPYQITMINMSYCPLIMNYRPAVVSIVLRVNQRGIFLSPSQEYVSLEFISNFKRFNFFHLTEAGPGRENVMGRGWQEI